MADVEEQCKLTRVLLYNNYNKVKFDEYTSITENFIIIENFLRKSNFLISTAEQKSATQINSEDDADTNDLIISNLKR